MIESQIGLMARDPSRMLDGTRPWCRVMSYSFLVPVGHRHKRNHGIVTPVANPRSAVFQSPDLLAEERFVYEERRYVLVVNSRSTLY